MNNKKKLFFISSNDNENLFYKFDFQIINCTKNLSNKISPFVRKGKKFTVTVVQYSKLPDIEQISDINNKNKNLSRKHNTLNKNVSYKFNNQNKNITNRYNELNKKFSDELNNNEKRNRVRRGRSLSFQEDSNLDKEKTVIRRRVKSQIQTENNELIRDHNPNHKIYDKMENYNVSSRVYDINDKYKSFQPIKNEGISKEALINIKYKMNQQLEKEKEKTSSLEKDNAKLQDMIKLLKKKIKEVSKNGTAKAYALSLPQINDLKQRNKTLKENIEKQELIMKISKRTKSANNNLKEIALTKRVNNGNEVKSRSLNTVSKIPKYVGNSNSSLSTKKNVVNQKDIDIKKSTRENDIKKSSSPDKIENNNPMNYNSQEKSIENPIKPKIEKEESIVDYIERLPYIKNNLLLNHFKKKVREEKSRGIENNSNGKKKLSHLIYDDIEKTKDLLRNIKINDSQKFENDIKKFKEKSRALALIIYI
ncbi:hypothetical protein LY90DRAFT_676129 [Neocallimastix californiae]|uniref:Uncharacterized protein n=1 Tax=Neocallimastix californiae TaxID=1754190 RepID=A0A1Y2AGT5_9FUNG|nr:hypothetical protein LY90DRAFT_676129 [Neocallimastix californiae]|eukprot:ORY21789.1 hypothetical protein LY90DRAFT_676129 [Neocallimastix californiae]